MQPADQNCEKFCMIRGYVWRTHAVLTIMINYQNFPAFLSEFSSALNLKKSMYFNKEHFM